MPSCFCTIIVTVNCGPGTVLAVTESSDDMAASHKNSVGDCLQYRDTASSYHKICCNIHSRALLS